MRQFRAVLTATALATTFGCNAPTERTAERLPSASATAVINYGDEGIALRSPSDVARLRTAPDGFAQYVAGRLDELIQADLEKECPPVIRVNVVDAAGFATGSVNGCGGYAVIWKQVDGVWQQILGGQDYWRCTDLHKHDVPVTVVHDGKCLEFTGKDTTVVPYPSTTPAQNS